MTNSSKNSDSLSRRSFLQSLVGIGLGSSVGSLSQLLAMQQAEAADTDYKALVCILLNGGNDSFNMLIPFGDTAGKNYQDYADIRGALAISDTDLGLQTVSSAGTDLNSAFLGSGAENPYYDSQGVATAYKKGVYSLTEKSIPLAVNGVMPEIAQLVIDNKASIVANIGNLVEPLSRSEILNDTANLPLFLFAHNHQKRALQTGQSDNLTDIGWAGRIADHWSGINNNHPLGLNVSYTGNMPMMIGKSTTPLVLVPGTPPQFSGMQFNNTSDSDRRALFKALAGQQNQSATGNITFNDQNTDNTNNQFRQVYNKSQLKSMQVFDALSASWPSGGITYTSKNSYGKDLFSIPTPDDLGLGTGIQGTLIKSLRDIATLIDLGAKNAFTAGSANRQIFMVSLHGFDTHGSQLTRHAPLLRELSLGLWSFQKAMEELGHANKVMTYTMSDFGRTMSNNGKGTDHGWGAHHLVMGGDGSKLSGHLHGGQMLGELPDIRLGSTDDHRDKGRIIPKLAQDQLNATLCDWFGVDEQFMALVFPNLKNFRKNRNLSSAYLSDLFVG